MDPEQALRAAIRACRGVVDPSPLEAALAELAGPATLVVVGRIGVGKSSFVAAVTGVARPVGLGGVTRSLEVVEAGGVRWVDTPGIDDVDRALPGLEPTLADADGVVWVTDGLQAWTASERALADEVLVRGRPWWLVVSRADLVPEDELGAVLERVRALSRPLSPVAVLGADLRGAARVQVRDAVRFRPPGPRRLAVARAAVERVAASLEASGPIRSPEEVDAVFVAGVRQLVQDLERSLVDGAATHPTEALALLGARSASVRAAVAEASRPVSAPPLPSPTAPSAPVVRQLLGRLAGVAGAVRLLRSEGARWLAEGAIVLTEGWPGRAELGELHRRRAHLVQALDAVRATL